MVVVASRPVGVSNSVFFVRAPSSMIYGDGNVGLDAELVVSTPISKGISSRSSPCAPVSLAGGGFPAPPPKGNCPYVGVLKKVASVAEPFPVCRSIALSLEEDTMVKMDHVAPIFAAHAQHYSIVKNSSYRSFSQVVTQDSPATTTVPLTNGVASPMVGGSISSWPELVARGCGLQAGVSFIEVVPLVVVRKEAIPNTPAFGTYDEAKARIELEIKLPKAITSTKRKAAKETEETEEESEEEAETPKKKGKVVITKPKLKTAVFTRRTRKGQKESEVVFRKPPPTFEEKLKQLEQGSGMSNFKALKYESRSDAEKMQIEELLLNKMGKWKYTPDDISSQIPNELLVRIRPRWTSAVQTVKDIYAQTLKQLLPNLAYKEVKEALKENEHQMTLRFHTFLVLSK
ncbi:hypothetical protein SUGI_0731710 [Cryptomeria japonica]|nr:hypothetical protein SUGI_0731710 [Cryptomeria japonica]